ncbi:MAG: hypothetical protein ACRD1Z_09015, partial [Vicinamibacteria bacterium]
MRDLVFRAFAAFLEPDRDLRSEVAEISLSGFQHHPRSLCPSAVVICANAVELPESPGEVFQTGLPDIANPARCGCVAASIRSIRDALDVRLGSLDG